MAISTILNLPNGEIPSLAIGDGLVIDRLSDGKTHYVTIGTLDARYSGGGAVDSVFTRTGAVIAAIGDYTAAQVTNAASVITSNTFTAAQTIITTSGEATSVLLLGQSDPQISIIDFDCTVGIDNAIKESGEYSFINTHFIKINIAGVGER